ncbi:MAG: 6-carboxytetrahydropterin synthase [Rickettsiaceae bacterium]|nr:6-carboxytetrahydropterin synthase [Rickettsiaceae bacterium]
MQCTRKIHFDAAHRVVGHKNKCQYLHGHRYVLEITASASQLDQLGMVADFAELKEIMNGWIEDNFDHNVILSPEDTKLGELIAATTGQKIYYIHANPTAENIVLYLKEFIVPKLFADKFYHISKLRLYETPNVFVEVDYVKPY